MLLVFHNHFLGGLENARTNLTLNHIIFYFKAIEYYNQLRAMIDWSQKTVDEKKRAKRSFFHRWVFQATFPTSPIMHFENTKSSLMIKLFSTNHITCHTLKDYYMNSQVANQMTNKLLKKIVGSSGNGDEQDFEKLKIAICETDNEGIKKVKWFLK